MERLKIAVCISGQMRNFEPCAGWIKTLEDDHDVDVFIHTWSDRGISTDLNRNLPKGMARFIDVDGIDPRKPIQLNKNLKILAALKPDNLITQELLQLHYKVKEAVIEDLPTDYNESKTLHGIRCPAEIINYSPRYYHNLAMFYKIHACDQLRQKAERTNGFTYDVVIRVRPDNLCKEFDKQLLRKQKFADDKLIYSKLSVQENSGLPYVSDQYAFGNSEAMKIYCSVWEKLKDYWDDKKYPDWKMIHRVIGLLVYKHILLSGGKVLYSKAFTFSLSADDTSIEKALQICKVIEEEDPILALTIENEIIYNYISEEKDVAQVQNLLNSIKTSKKAKLLAEMQLAFKNNDSKLVKVIFSNISKLKLKSASAQVIYINFLIRAKTLEQAKDLAYKALLAHRDERLYSKLGHIYKKQNLLQAAIYYYSNAADVCYRDVDKLSFYNEIGKIYLKLKQFDKSVAYFNKMLEINSNDLAARCGIKANLLKTKHDTQQDFAEVQKLWNKCKNVETGLLYADYVLKYKADDREAMQLVEIAHKFPKNIHLKYKAIKILLRLGKFREAKDIAKLILKKNGNDTIALQAVNSDSK